MAGFASNARISIVAAAQEKEKTAREALISIGKKLKLYFVVYDDMHGSRKFIAMNNDSKKKVEVYSMAFFTFSADKFKNDTEAFNFMISHKFTWANILSGVKANLPCTVNIRTRHSHCRLISKLLAWISSFLPQSKAPTIEKIECTSSRNWLVEKMI